ncbi:MAG: ABC transporter ATP-binding protein [Infirmifilum sp.]
MALRVEGVTKSFSGLTVLRDVSLEAQEGKITCVVGPNGSGKTTLLRILALLEKPDRGKIIYDGREISGIDKDYRRSLAYVPQRPVVLTASVYNNIYIPLRARGLSAAEASERAKRLLALTGLARLSKTPAQKLSGGQKQLLALARALALEPKILILDEPTSHLDVANAPMMRSLILEYVRDERAVAVVSTHTLDEVMELSDQTILLVGGAIRGVFTTKDNIKDFLRFIS